MILIDQPLWWHRGRRWSHMASDVSIDELRRFAEANGLDQRTFHGDHYDVPEEYLARLIAAGAVSVSSRELLERLRAAGLRLSPSARRSQARG
ncbi:MAG: DUF4031 domain-containing protein [Actinomycetota bacterium]|nr:DUF4031 domain-containing protein [Actinomycetota bacterium]MDA3014027.1 DUF4031 domain-containing protein [Actinomycetota bacterium]MDA3027365.1 DUF4031 domain-containing protein [Actinomycetota bacterium]